MLTKSNGMQGKVIVTTLESLMPQEHFLRDLNRLVNFSFIYGKVKHLYSTIGRPSVDPVVLIKMLLIGFLYGIDSERKIEKEVQVNIAFRWFLGIDLDENVPDHSTISQTRRRKLKDTDIFEEMFAEIVKKCIDVGLVDGSLILTDSTHIKASASTHRAEMKTVTVEPRAYIKKLEQLCQEDDLKIRAQGIEAGKKKCGIARNEKPKTKTILVSTTDPDSGIMSRPDKPRGFHYLNHQSTDAKSGIITDVFVTPGNVNDNVPYVGRIKHQKGKLGLPIKEVGADKGYDFVEIHKEMLDLGIRTYITPYTRETKRINDTYPPAAFHYDFEKDCFTCPNGAELTLLCINQSQRLRVYAASRKSCKTCELFKKCIGGQRKTRQLSVPYFDREARLQRENYRTPRYYEVQRLRRIYCEGNFALQKENHNLRNTRKRGNKNVTEHCLFSALALNLKRLVKYLKANPEKTLLYRLFCTFSSQKAVA